MIIAIQSHPRYGDANHVISRSTCDKGLIRPRLKDHVGISRGRTRYGTSRKSSRQAHTLVEMLVVISLLTLVLSLAAMTFHLLLRSEKDVVQSFVTERTISRLAVVFRDDIHQSSSGELKGTSPSGGVQLSLSAADQETVHYMVTDRGVLRLRKQQEDITARDDFELPDCEVHLTAGTDELASLRSLVIERPATSLGGKRVPTVPRRKLRIEAFLRETGTAAELVPVQKSAESAEAIEKVDAVTNVVSMEEDR